jgi:hypothetical protein
VTYLITFACHGCRLRGNASDSVDSAHNVPGTPVLEENSARAAFEEQRMDQPPYPHARDYFAHGRQQSPATMSTHLLNGLQYRLNRMNLDQPNRKKWARHGSTRWLWKPQHVSAAIQYVVDEQGRTMSAFESQEAI